MYEFVVIFCTVIVCITIYNIFDRWCKSKDRDNELWTSVRAKEINLEEKRFEHHKQMCGRDDMEED